MLEPTWTALKHHRRLHQIVATLVRFGAQDVLIRLGLGRLLAEVDPEPDQSLPATARHCPAASAHGAGSTRANVYQVWADTGESQ